MNGVVDDIIKIGNCPGCGGHYTFDGTCFFCHSKNEELASLLLEVKRIMESNKSINELNDIDNQLFRLKYFEEINNYLKNKNYHELLKIKEDNLYNKINENNFLITNTDDLKMIQFLSINSLDSNHKIAFGLYTILNNYASDYRYDKKDFIETIKSTFIEMMKKYTYIPKLEITKIESKDCKSILGNESFVKKGKHNVTRIEISKSEIEKLYSKESILPLQTLFHEYYHLVQESLLREAKVFSRDSLNQIEDFILSKFNQSKQYYEMNYRVLTFENEAEVSSSIEVTEMLKRFNIKFKNSDLKEINEVYSRSKSLLSIPQFRLYEGNKYTLDNLFDMFLSSTDKVDNIFEMYTQLNYIYKKVDGKYSRLPEETINELIDLYNKVGFDINGNRINKYQNEIESSRTQI